MLDVYWGEFGINPIPLEMSLNWCSHACAYCFANLNNPERTADVGAIARLIAEYPSRKSVSAMLLRDGYPVLISNRVDPFANSNYKQSLPIIRQLHEMGIPVAIQTKGGRGIDDVLEYLPPSCWYISISFWDDARRRQIEPGATSVKDRLALMEKLSAKGHVVYLGLNPLVPEWLPDPMPLLRACKDSGVYGVWTELLHLNKSQAERLTDKERAALGEDVIARADMLAPDDEKNYWEDARACVLSLGMEVFSIRQTNKSAFFEPYRRLYPNTFSVHQDFVNWCHDSIEDGALVSFDDYWGVMSRGLPVGVHLIENYLRVPNRAAFLTHKIPARMTYRQLLQIAWADGRMWLSPSRFGCFGYAAERDGKGWVSLVDENNLPYMVFKKTELNDFYAEVEVVNKNK